MSRAPGAVRMRRREFLRAGLAGLAASRCPSLIALRRGRGLGSSGERTALLVVWLQGGASHLETYDPKPDAPAEIRGPFGRSPRRPRACASASCCRCHAAVADRFAILRSLVAHGVLPPAGQSADVHGAPRAGAQAQARPPRPDVRRAPGAVRPGPPGADLRRRQPDPVPRLGLPRPGLRAVRRPRRPERAGLRGPRHRPRATPAEVGRLRRPDGPRGAVRRAPPRARRPDAVGRLRRLPAAGVHAPDRPRGAAGVRPRAGKTRGSATATAGTPGASAACWPGGWSRRASTS